MNKIIPIRLRYSTLETLTLCERKFQLDNMLQGSQIREESEHLSFGTAYGAGLAHYLIHQDEDLALYHGWLSYWPEIESDKKNVPLLIAGLRASFPKLNDLLEEYEVVTVKGKPAAELTFRLDINEEFYFTGAIDIVLKHKYTGLYYVLDAKTTGLQLLDVSPLYMNSAQTLGYSIAIDAMVGEKLTSYGVLYFVLQMGKTAGHFKIHVLPFDKTILDRLNWFLTLGMDVERIKRMEEMGVYPKRGGACLHYMRPCKYFGTCGLHSLDARKEPEEDPVIYDLRFNLNDIIKDHIGRVANLETIL